MANFSQSFTGKGTAVILPESGALKTQEGLSKMVLDAEKLRYEVYQKNYSEFLKNTDIDPGFLMSDSARKYMNDRILAYSTKYGKIMQENGGVLPNKYKSDMQTERNLIESDRDGLLADQEMWKQHRALIEKDMGVNLMPEEFVKASEEYVRGESKRWNYTVNDFLRPKDFGMKLREIAMKQPNRIPNITKERPSAMIDVGMGKIAEEYYTVAEDQVDGLIASVFANYPAERKDAFMKWENEDKAKYDYDILKWLKEKYSAEARPLMTGAATTRPGARGAATTGFNTKLPVGPDNNKNKDYDIQTDQPYGKFNFKTFVNLSPTETGGRTQPVKSYIDLTTGEEKHPSGSLSFKVVGYSPSDDLIIVNMTQDVIGKPEDYIRAGTDIGLKGSEYDDVIRRKFGVYREGLMKEHGTSKGNNIPPLLKRPTYELDDL